MPRNLSLDFIPECYIDTNLVETLLGGKVNHQYGCNNVVNKMTGKYEDVFAVGIIDNDKRKISYVDDFNKIGSSEHLILLKHKYRQHYIIKVSPAMEEFILSCAEECGIDLTEYGLSNELEGLMSFTKNVESEKDERFKKAFGAMMAAKEMEIFGDVLEYLNEKRYDCDMNVLRSFFESNE